MRHHIRISAVVASLVMAACGRQSDIDDEMRRDLDAASVPTLELAPAGGGQRVVSALEQVQKAQPSQGKAHRAGTPVAAPPTSPPPPSPVETAPQGTPATSNEPAATRPSAGPKVNPPPPGGYKTVDEVIRNAPFPIKPATKRPNR